MRGSYHVGSKLLPYYDKAVEILQALPPSPIFFLHVRREFNKVADRLANICMDIHGNIDATQPVSPNMLYWLQRRQRKDLRDQADDNFRSRSECPNITAQDIGSEFLRLNKSLPLLLRSL